MMKYLYPQVYDAVQKSRIWVPVNQYLPAITYDSDAMGGLVALNAAWALSDIGARLIGHFKSREKTICDKI